MALKLVGDDDCVQRQQREAATSPDSATKRPQQDMPGEAPEALRTISSLSPLSLLRQ